MFAGVLHVSGPASGGSSGLAQKSALLPKLFHSVGSLRITILPQCAKSKV